MPNKSLKHRHFVAGQFLSRAFVVLLRKIFPIVSNKGLRRFSLRGKAKVQGQWQLFCLIHNMEKLANYGNLIKVKRK
ncbi:MAG TPA: transposase [Cellvibrio sp.]|nr:transposase [Cellvibrio sp.]